MGKKKMILIAEDDLKTIVSDAVKTALDTVTKKIAAKCATLSYNNEMFAPEEKKTKPWSYTPPPCSCGNTGSCGSSSTQRISYGFSCGSAPSSGGC